MKTTTDRIDTDLVNQLLNVAPDLQNIYRAASQMIDLIIQ